MSETVEKFFFDQNVFDEDHIEEDLLEPEEPPPPTFTEAEIEAAKNAAFRRGQTQGIEEEKNSREQHLASAMDVLAKNMAMLFAQEQAREAVYEREAVELVGVLLKRLYPHFSQQNGFDELKASLHQIIASQSGRQSVLVRVAPDMTDGIERFLKDLQARQSDILFTVKGDESLSGTQCELSWEHGGARHDPESIANQIMDILSEGLAGRATKSHDSKEELC